jgi:hypothetical protein
VLVLLKSTDDSLLVRRGNPRKYMDALRAHRQLGIGHRFHLAAEDEFVGG